MYVCFYVIMCINAYSYLLFHICLQTYSNILTYLRTFIHYIIYIIVLRYLRVCVFVNMQTCMCL